MFVRTTCINKILKLEKRIKGVQGGTSAGKTYGIIPILINRAIKNPGLEVSIVSESVPHLKRGVIRDFKKIMKQTGRWSASRWHGTDSIYTFTNGSFIEFFSADDDSKLKGARRDILYINEANNIDFESYRQLAKRTKVSIYLDWNPTNEFWFHEELKNDEDVDFMIVTYLDNEACPQSAIDDIKKGKRKAFFEPDLPVELLFKEANIKNEYWANDYKVYGLGLLGQLQGAIFKDWGFGEFDLSLPYAYGLDFGFNDPDALIKVAVDERREIVYFDECLYKNNSGSSELGKIIRDRIHNQGDLIVADHESRLIDDLYYNERLNIIKAQKPKGSVSQRYKKLQGYRIVITEKSLNIEKELINHCWHDKISGIPAKDKWHHCLDGGMYGASELYA